MSTRTLWTCLSAIALSSVVATGCHHSGGSSQDPVSARVARAAQPPVANGDAGITAPVLGISDAGAAAPSPATDGGAAPLAPDAGNSVVGDAAAPPGSRDAGFPPAIQP